MAALRGLSDEELDREVTAPWGAPFKALFLAGVVASHMEYHGGQVNYIQSLYGDAEMHW